jgi:hypothetical protein
MAKYFLSEHETNHSRRLLQGLYSWALPNAAILGKVDKARAETLP